MRGVAVALLLLQAWAAPAVTHLVPPSDVPLIDECSVCDQCIVDAPPPDLFAEIPQPPPGWKAKKVASSPFADLLGHRRSLRSHARSLKLREDEVPLDSYASYIADMIRPMNEKERSKLPECAVCRGCNVELEPVDSKAQSHGGMKFHHQRGSSKNWIFFAHINGTKYVVKVYNHPAGSRRALHTPRLYSLGVQAQYSFNAIAEECGVMDEYPKFWMAKISAIEPDSGYIIQYHAIFYEMKDGVPLHDLISMLAEGQRSEQLVKMLDTGLNSTQILIGATMDMLTLQCDRHKGNFIIGKDARIHFIDVERSLGIYPECGYNSLHIFNSRTVNREVLRLFGLDPFSEDTVPWPPAGTCASRALHFARYDYRCHAEGGLIGKNYPPSVAQCIQKIAAMDAKQVAEKFYLLDWQAKMVWGRARDLYTNGFEWTLEHAAPPNEERFVVPYQPPCCQLDWDKNVHWPTCKTCWKAVVPQRPSK